MKKVQSWKELTLREKIGQTMMLENFDTYCEKFGGIEAFLKKYTIGSVYVGGAIVGDKGRAEQKYIYRKW